MVYPAALVSRITRSSKSPFGYAIDQKGTVVNIGSIHAKLTKPAFISYATSKAALRGLTQSLAVYCGEDIRVNMVEPAAIATPILLEGFVGNPDALEGLENYHPVGRLGLPVEVAELVVYLVSDVSSFMTGSVIEFKGRIGSRLHDPV
jgi:NAD(P)-dependent dehydrogenase (short-subunit alcohol dehydrogenase family)